MREVHRPPSRQGQVDHVALRAVVAVGDVQ